MGDYRFLEDFATADIALEATGGTLEEVFVAAADATMNVMIESLDSIEDRTRRNIELKNDQLDMLLFDLLQELIYYKDAEQLLLRIKEIVITEQSGASVLHATAGGETLNPDRHEQRADVKAVTLHHFSLDKTEHGWKALVILDI
jgi:SHS2 domain-containing protein